MTLAEVAARTSDKVGFGRSAIERPSLVFLPLGMAIGPRGLNLLPESMLSYLEPAVASALAAIGALAGLGLFRDRRRAPALGRGVAVETGLTIAAVGAGALMVDAFVPRFGDAMWVLAPLLGFSAAASSTARRDTKPPWSSFALRICELDTVLAMVLGGLALAWVRYRSVDGAVWLNVEIAAIAAMIAAAGWLLAGQTSDDHEQRVYAAGTLLLLGGAAEYVGASALLAGLLAGACWRVAGGAARDRLTRDVQYLRHPLIGLLLLIGGARFRFSIDAAVFVAVYVMCRTAAKLAGGWLIGRFSADDQPLALGLYLLPPGVVGVAFALNTMAVWPDAAAAAMLLDVVVLGSLVSELLAVAYPPAEAA